MDNSIKLLSLKQISTALNISRATLYRLRRNDPNFPRPYVSQPLRWNEKHLIKYFETTSKGA